MGQNVVATVKSGAAITQTPSTGALSGTSVGYGPNFQAVMKLAGVLADQIDTVYDATLTFVASTPQTVSLNASGTNDPFGNANTFARVRAIAIRNKSQTDNHWLLIGDAVTNEWDGFLSAAATLKVFPSSTVNDGWFLLVAPMTTGIAVGGSNYALKLDPGSFSDIIADVVILGCST